jgi:hypothetical protein
MEGHVAYMTEKRYAYKVLVEKPEYKGPLGRPRHKQENNIKVDLEEIVWEVVD